MLRESVKKRAIRWEGKKKVFFSKLKSGREMASLWRENFVYKFFFAKLERVFLRKLSGISANKVVKLL